MLELFRSNRFFSYVMLWIYTMALQANYVFQTEYNYELSDSNPLIGWVEQLYVQYPMISKVIHVHLIFVGAFILTWITNSQKLSQQQQVLSGVIFVLLATMTPAIQQDIPLQISLFFAVLAYSQLIDIQSNKSNTIRIFNLGLWVSVSSFFFPPMLLIGFALFGSLSIQIKLEIKSFLQFLVGMLTPYFMHFVVVFSTVGLPGSDFGLLISDIGLGFSLKPVRGSEWIYAGVILVLVFFALFKRSSVYYKKNVVSKRKINTIYIMLFSFPMLLFLQREISISHFLLMSLPIGLLVGIIISEMKNKLIGELIHVAILGTFLFLHFSGASFLDIDLR